MQRSFIKGLDLCELFYQEAVRPILSARFPALAYSAALIGPGSDVLGFDTPQSMDHEWGPRLMVFLDEADCAHLRYEVDQTLHRELPHEIHGYPTHFGQHDDDTSVRMASAGPVHHRVKLYTVRDFFAGYLHLDPRRELGAIDWLTLPEQLLRSITAGRVFHDGLEQLEPIRKKLDYYPRDVWLYLLAAQWQRIAQEEAIMGRCGQAGDDLGSRLLAARLVRDIMRLCFLMERQYEPYIKWLGTAFAQLECADELSPIFTCVLQADSWQGREKHMTQAYERVANMHNTLGITVSLSTQVSPFYDRPFRVLHANRFAEAIHAAITSDEVRALPDRLGSIDQFVDSTDALNLHHRFKAIYE